MQNLQTQTEQDHLNHRQAYVTHDGLVTIEGAVSYHHVNEQTDELMRSVQGVMAVCHKAALNWWFDPKTGEDVRINPLLMSNKLMLIVSELAEAMEGDRKNQMDDKLPHRKMVEVELADAFIRICDTAAGFKLDLAGAVVEKLAYNAQRADHKIENRAAEGGKSY